MTKHVRIENADLSKHKLIVEVWESDGQTERLVSATPLSNPTDMTTQMVYGSAGKAGRYLIVREAP